MLSSRAARVAPLIIALTSATTVLAEPEAAPATSPRISVALAYQAPAGCPAEAEFRDLVAARVGYDPFSADAELKLTVELSATDGKIRGVWSISEPAQRRELTVAKSECAELATSFALSVSVAVDQLAAEQAAVAAKTAESQEQPKQPRAAQTLDAQLGEPPRAAPKPNPEEKSGTAIELRASVHAALGLVPQLTGGGVLGIAVRTQSWSLGVDGRAELPRSELSADGTGVRGGLIGGGPVACFHFAPGAVCALSVLGAFRGEGVNVDGRDRDSTFYASVGVRGALELTGHAGSARSHHSHVAANRGPHCVVDAQYRRRVGSRDRGELSMSRRPLFLSRTRFS